MIPAVEVAGARVFLGDCRDVLKGLPDNSVDSIVTDPPYGLGFMGKKWDTFGGKAGISESVAAEIQGRYREKAPGTPRYAGTARPAKPSDGEMLAFQLWCTEWAVECLRVLKPGGHILAFGGSRTWHRLAVAVEDAGFELRDSIAWIYGSGFPKSLDVSKAIDKMDAKGERLARSFYFTNWCRQHLTARQIDDITGTKMGNHLTTHPTQPFVPTEEMFAMLRPHLPDVPEDIERLVFERTVESKNFAEREVIGQKMSGIADKNEKGRHTIGASKAVEVDITAPSTLEAKAWQGWGTALKPAFEPVVVGRKPLVGTVAENVLLWGVGGLNIDGSRIGSENRENQPASSLGNAHTLSGGKAQTDRTPNQVQGRWPANVILDEVSAGLLDEQSGGLKARGNLEPTKRATAFFNSADKSLSQVDFANDTGGASRFFYVAKASKRDRNEGLEELEATSAGDMVDRVEGSAGMDSPRAGAGRTSGAKNFHPTVKPTQLMRYLIKLVTPAGGTVLDPFTGSGSTGKAALLDGYGFIGAELTEEYLPIIEGRLRWAAEQEGEDDGKLF